jgi:thioesterase domain-containing protein/acyl carrier protein
LLLQFDADPAQHDSNPPSPPLRAVAAAPPAPPETLRDRVAPRDDVERKLVEIWQAILERPKIGVHDNFFDLGGQSLMAARLMSTIEKQFERKIDLSTLIGAPTVAELAHILRSKEESESSLIVPLRDFGNRLPLFCFHCGTGHVLRYREMAAAMNADQPIYGLRAPDIDGARSTLSVEELADRYLREIRAIQNHGPYQLCGLSFGGLVAYELACRLADAGEEVSMLGLFDTGNPAYYRDLPFAKSVEFRMTYLIDRFRKYGRRIGGFEIGKIYRDLYIFVTRRFDRLVWKMARKLSHLLGRPMPEVIRDNAIMFTAIGQAYSPKPYSGRVLLFRAEGRTKEYGDDMFLGWEAVARGGIEVHHVPGEHTTLLEKPNVFGLVEQLESCMTAGTPPDDTFKGR